MGRAGRIAEMSPRNDDFIAAISSVPLDFMIPFLSYI